jgi:hypothetical protein
MNYALVRSLLRSSRASFSSLLFLFLAAAIQFTVAIQPATAQLPPAVYTRGCPPPPPPTGNTWYVDPVNGSMSGDGSAAHPWQTLAGVVNANLISSYRYSGSGGYNWGAGTLYPLNPSAPIKAGDVIYLMSGNHGVVNLHGYENSGYITVQAAPGQTPVLSCLSAVGCSNWVFSGLTVQNTCTGGTATNIGTLVGCSAGTIDLVLLEDDESFYGPSNNIWFENNLVQAAPNLDNWTAAQWISNAPNGILVRNNYTTLINNTITNVRFPLGLYGANNVLIYGNSIDNFGDDGIDYDGQHCTIQNNTVTNHIYIADPYHIDGMQGQYYTPAPPANPNTYVSNDWIIDSNVIMLRNRPLSIDDPVNNTMQGIDNFCGGHPWTNVSVTNNLVVSEHTWNGITFYSATNCNIINNTVIGADPGTPGLPIARIVVYGTTTNNVVRNNVAMGYGFSANGQTPIVGVTADHNITSVVGTATDPSLLYVTYNPPYTFDAHPLPGGPLVGAGSPTLAPPYDIQGITRVPPITVGAYDVYVYGGGSGSGSGGGAGGGSGSSGNPPTGHGSSGDPPSGHGSSGTPPMGSKGGYYVQVGNDRYLYYAPGAKHPIYLRFPNSTPAWELPRSGHGAMVPPAFGSKPGSYVKVGDHRYMYYVPGRKDPVYIRFPESTPTAELPR